MVEKIEIGLLPPNILNETRVVEIPLRLVDEAVQEWSSAVVCYSVDLKLGAEGVRRYAQKAWKPKGEMKVF